MHVHPTCRPLARLRRRREQRAPLGAPPTASAVHRADTVLHGQTAGTHFVECCRGRCPAKPMGRRSGTANCTRAALDSVKELAVCTPGHARTSNQVLPIIKDLKYVVIKTLTARAPCQIDSCATSHYHPNHLASEALSASCARTIEASDLTSKT